jgi:argininosuccinate synthase
MPSCVLAYSGGLDTSVILGWLMDEGYDVHCVYVDLGQPCEDREAILQKAKNIGAKSARIVDAQEEMCRDFAFPVLQWDAKYEDWYLLGTSIARPLISKVCLQLPGRWGRCHAHGATGKGNDQCRFNRPRRLDPNVKSSPVANQQFRNCSPAARIDHYCRRKTSRQGVVTSLIPTKTACASATRPALEDAANGVDLPGLAWLSPQKAPDKVERLIGFEPVASGINGIHHRLGIVKN